MPTPNKDESKDDFIDRCIPIVMNEEEDRSSEQAVAMCYSYWEENKKKG